MYDRRGIPQLPEEVKPDPMKDIRIWVLFLLGVMFILQFLK